MSPVVQSLVVWGGVGEFWTGGDIRRTFICLVHTKFRLGDISILLRCTTLSPEACVCAVLTRLNLAPPPLPPFQKNHTKQEVVQLKANGAEAMHG